MGLKSRFSVAWGVVGGAWLWDCSLGVNEKVIKIASNARKSRENGFLHLPKLDFHRFSLIFIEVLKIAENLEKQSFTFFAFLPPYIGVSGSLVSRKR